MRNLLIAALLSLIIYGCNKSSDIVNPEDPIEPITSTKPAWPMPGYNARNTSNPYAPTVVMNPVVNGALDWSYTLPACNNTCSEGCRLCVDSKGFIYYLQMRLSYGGGFYKFSPEGNVVWKKDSLKGYSFNSTTLNSDESKIYFIAQKKNYSSENLYCLDSAGKEYWNINSVVRTYITANKEGNIIFYKGGLSMASSDGVIKWTNNSIQVVSELFALDKNDNIFVVSHPSNLVKVDKFANFIWSSQFGNNGIVIDGYGNIYGCGLSEQLNCLNSSGLFKWTGAVVNHFSSPVISKDNKILVSSGEYIISYDTSGTELWKTKAFTNNLNPYRLVLDDADNVYYVGHNSTVYAGSISSKGIKRWEVNTNHYNYMPISSVVLLPQGKLIVNCEDAGIIQAIN